MSHWSQACYIRHCCHSVVGNVHRGSMYINDVQHVILRPNKDANRDSAPRPLGPVL